MELLRNKFHLVLGDPQLHWRDRDGKYTDPRVEMAWQCVVGLGGELEDSANVDRLIAVGSTELRTRLRKILVDKFNALGMSQTKFAAALDMHQSEVSWLINGKDTIGLEKLIDLVRKASQLSTNVATL